MDRVTQNNASQTEEMAGTAEALQNHSEQLRELVTRFRLESSDGDSSPKAVRRTESYQAAKQRQIETNLDKVVGRLETAGAGFVEF
jgi:nitrate/nitrite-specific signal transduction histidine kinase